MKKRILIGLIVALLTLAAQDGFFGANAGISGDFRTRPTQMGGNESVAPKEAAMPLVTRVVDGDTIIVLIDRVSEKVRLIGVDTPETVDPRKPVQCFGKEASAFTKALLLNTPVKLEIDPTQGDRDKYGRLLRYVFLADGTLVNQKIIAEGYGHEYTYKLPYRYQTEFKTAERAARESEKEIRYEKKSSNSVDFIIFHHAPNNVHHLPSEAHQCL